MSLNFQSPQLPGALRKRDPAEAISPKCRLPALFPPVLLNVTTYMLFYILERPLNIVDEFLLLLLFFFLKKYIGSF